MKPNEIVSAWDPDDPRLPEFLLQSRSRDGAGGDNVESRVKIILSARKPVTDEVMLNLGSEFIRAAEYANEEKLHGFVSAGFPVNWQEPRTGQTALHIVAAGRARAALRTLLKSADLDFLLRDHKGRLASEMASLYGEDLAVARLLGIKERQQADAQGITLTRRP